MQKISVSVGKTIFDAELNDSVLATKFAGLLPFECEMSRWGDEYYGACGLAISNPDMTDAREIMEIGEIAYWPTGDALCFFFGQTPASTDDRPRAVSPVVPMGRFVGMGGDVRRDLRSGVRENSAIVTGLTSGGPVETVRISLV